MAATEDRVLLSTGDAARALGIDRTTLARWATAGIVSPASRTAGGHLRWNLATLREQLAEHAATTAGGSSSNETR